MSTAIRICLFRCLLSLLAAAVSDDACARGFRAECEARLESTSVSATPESTPYITSSALSIGELTIKDPPRQAHERTLGLTVAHYVSTINFEQNGLRGANPGEYCMRPHFSVKLSYSPIEVYVGREIPRGSCAYAEVVHHEEKHVAAYVRQLREAAAAVERAMRAYYGNVIFYGDADQLATQLTYQVKQHWLPLAEQQLSAVEEVQQAIDSPQEYARNRAACNGEIGRVLRGVR
jgi:hypothetical protein